LYNPPETVDFLKHIWQQSGSSPFIAETMVRLLLAAVLGGAIGLERELRHRPTGLRTNLFICFGSAMYTIMSFKLAGEFSGDHTRIAAQIIPGIGFIGAGSIIHARAGVTGLTSAATLFVVASIGMACGGGLYAPAVFATVMILLSLVLLGRMEERFGLKTFVTGYEVTGQDSDRVIGAINSVLEDEHKVMQTVSVGRLAEKSKVQFTVEGTRREHESLQARLRILPEAEQVHSFILPEYE
jgi:putative Mg2+ transporter-C (MgtC) family protein